MNITTLTEQLSSQTRDIKLNLESVLTPEGAPDLNQEQIYGIALATAFATKQQTLIKSILEACTGIVSPNILAAAKTAAIIMSMNNVYYRFVHLVSDNSYHSMPANLRMNALMNPGIPKLDFELYALAVSALNGCGLCIDAHAKKLEQEGMSKLSIQSSIRIAAVINATATAFSLREID